MLGSGGVGSFVWGYPMVGCLSVVACGLTPKAGVAGYVHLSVCSSYDTFKLCLLFVFSDLVIFYNSSSLI